MSERRCITATVDTLPEALARVLDVVDEHRIVSVSVAIIPELSAPGVPQRFVVAVAGQTVEVEA